MSPLFLFLLTMIPGTVLLGFYDVSTKRLLQKGISEQTLLGVGFSGAGLVFLTALSFSGIPEISPSFTWVYFLATALTIFGQFAWYRAFNYGTVSFIASLRVLTPVIIIFTGSLFLGEVPSQSGLFGITLTVLGLLLLLGARAGVRFPPHSRGHSKVQDFCGECLPCSHFRFRFHLIKKRYSLHPPSFIWQCSVSQPEW